MVNFPSFTLTLEDKSSMQADVDALIAEAQDKLALAPYPTMHDYRDAYGILKEATMLIKDLLKDLDEEKGEDDGDEDGSSPTKAYRRQTLNHSLAEASLLRGDVLDYFDKIPEARAAYTDAFTRCPAASPAPDAHAALTSAPRKPSQIPRPSASSASAATLASKRTARRERAWDALKELSRYRDVVPGPSATTSTSDMTSGTTTRRSSTQSDHVRVSRRERRRAGIWDSVYYPHTVQEVDTREDMINLHIDRLRWDPETDVPTQDVGAQKKVSIVEYDESASGSSASSAVGSDRSIQHKKKCTDRRTLRSHAREPRRTRDR
ncbi:hypothetical protein PG994_013777 [Apiospora phragmitis]|uniref:Uncharacterized protein n=1 Tax=Apiospora phragmitis TaxID=2905665 RepID=A0ABR1T2E9_9PEZI